MLETQKPLNPPEKPPEPVLTRWGTWLGAADYYAENYLTVKEFVLQLDAKSQAIQNVKTINENDSELLAQLEFLKSNLVSLMFMSQKLLMLKEVFRK